MSRINVIPMVRNTDVEVLVAVRNAMNDNCVEGQVRFVSVFFVGFLFNGEDGDFGTKGAMHRALVGDLEQCGALIVVERANEGDVTINPGDEIAFFPPVTGG